MRWGLDPVGRRGALLALVAFLAVLTTRLVDLGSPPGMYFDEEFYARAAGEYLQGKESSASHHPPLAPELMSLSLRWLAGYGVHGKAHAPRGLSAAVAATGGKQLAWAAPSGPSTGLLWTGRFTRSCGVAPRGRPVPVGVSPAAVGIAEFGTLVAGAGPAGPSLQLVQDGRPQWTVLLPESPVAIAVGRAGGFVLTNRGTLLSVNQVGSTSQIASGVAAVAADELGGVVASVPAANQVLVYPVEGFPTTSTVPESGRPRAIASSVDAEETLVADESRARILSAVTSNELRGVAADRLVLVPETGLIWAQHGRDLRVIEPRGLTEIGRARLDAPPSALLGDGVYHRLVAVTGRDVECASGRGPFSWRLGSAVLGAATAALLVLLALRLFGSAQTGLLAAGLLAVEGMSFILARVAMLDTYVTAFIVSSWFCALSYLRSRDAGARGLGWLAATGVAGGLAVASKWDGAFALGVIALLLVADAVTRKRAVTSVAAIAGGLGVLPLAIYVASYVPYFRLGHSVQDLVRYQVAMVHYHEHLQEVHQFGSRWFEWPVARKAILMFRRQAEPGTQDVWMLANPVVFLGGIVGLAALAITAARRRTMALAMIPVAALVEWLPWSRVSRLEFLFYYLPVVPFLALGLAWALVIGLRAAPRRNTVIAAVTGAALAAFLVVLPMLDGQAMSESYHHTIHVWFGWVF